MRFQKKGTTLIELLIVIAIIAILISFSFLNLFGTRGQNDLKSASQQIVATLREARSRSVAQTSGTGWGVHFENSANPFYALFYSATYVSTTIIGYYSLPSDVGYATSDIAFGSFKEISFSQLSGLASASTSITIYLLTNPASSFTISMASSGAVSY